MPSIQDSRTWPPGSRKRGGWRVVPTPQAAGEAEIAGQEREHTGHLSDEGGEKGDTEDEVAVAGVLRLLTVGRAADDEVVPVGGSSGVTTHIPMGP